MKIQALRSGSRGWWLAAVSGLLCAVTGVHAETLTVRTAALVPVSSSWGFSTATTHTHGVAWTGSVAPEIVELGRALSRGGTCTGSCYADQVYQYVRNNIGVEFRFGLGKGGRGALVDQSGTPFDQAELMVALLRQGSVTASYQVGTLTLNATQFQQWTGMTNALGACQFLADGGISASMNGATSCSSLSAGTAVSSVVMAHIWVTALGNLYDPSYKIHVVSTGIGSSALATALGCGSSCATGVLGSVPTPTPSGISGVYQIQNVNQPGLESQLKTYATNLEHYIQSQNRNNYTSADPNMQVEDLVGGRVIDTNQPIPLPSATLYSPLSASAYAPNGSYAWSGDIPDQFRTTFTVQLGAASSGFSINQQLYADETAGSRLRLFSTTGNATGTSVPLQTGLYSESMLLAAGTLPNQSGFVPLTLTVQHPYANASSGYLSETQAYTILELGGQCYTVSIYGGGPICVMAAQQITIVQGLGHASESTIAHYAALTQRDETHTPPPTLSPQNPSLSASNHVWLTDAVTNPTCTSAYTLPTGPTAAAACVQKGQATFGASWLAQSSRVLDLAAAVNGTVVQEHDNFGLVVSGPVLGGSTLLSVQPNVSFDVNTASGTTADTSGAYYSAGVVLSRLEGAMYEQQDVWEGGSPVSLMVRSVTNQNSASMPLYDLTQANSAAASAASKNGGLLNTYSNGSNSYFDTYIKPYLDAGGEVILPQKSYAGTLCGSQCATYNFNGYVTYVAGGSQLTYQTGFPDVKGAVGPSNPFTLASQQATIKDYSTKKRGLLTVEPGSGDVSLKPAPDLVTGTGEFPESLAFQRVYSDGQAYGCAGTYGPCSRGTAELSVLPFGWSHTLAITAHLMSDGLASLGRNSALDASAAIAALYTVRQLNAGTRTFQSNVASLFVANWLGTNLTANVVAVRRPPIDNGVRGLA